MTERLYYADCYLRSFDTRVVNVKTDDSRILIRLEQTAFYPTSGGQPYDTGTINSAKVKDVFIDRDGEIWHEVDKEIAIGDAVHCEIDWHRRFDHMQQHAGEHMLANAAWRLLGGVTIGLHLGAEFSTIDMTLPGGADHITRAQIKALEDDVNSRIQRDVPIICGFPSDAELQTLPLRKPPAVNTHVRVVQIGDIEYCACGGTHPSSAGQIGLLKVIDARPSRGKLRVAFVCGKRAYELLRNHYDIASDTALALSTSVYNLPTLVCDMDARLKSLAHEIAILKREKALTNVPQLIAAARVSASGYSIVAAECDADIDTAREIAAEIAKTGNSVAIISIPSKSAKAYILARSNGVDADCGRLLSSAAKRANGKGGGRADFAQGAGGADMLKIMSDDAALL